MASATEKVVIENVNHPGRTQNVDRDRYDAMRRTYLSVLPESGPGMTPAEVLDRLTAELPADLFPGGARAGWWSKAVQLDLEAKGLIARVSVKPVRLRKVARRAASR